MDPNFNFLPYFSNWYTFQIPENYQRPEESFYPALVPLKQEIDKKKKKYERTWTKSEVEEIFNFTVNYCQEHNKNIEDLTLNDFALISIGKRQSPEEIMKKIKEIKANGTLRPGKWSIHEDNLLLELIAKHKKNWGCIANELNIEMHGRISIRNSKTCKERWNNYLDPSINRGAWTKSEDILVLEQYLKHGNRWKIITKAIPNRIESYVKNRVKSILHKLKSSLSSGKNITESITDLIENIQKEESRKFDLY